MNKKVKLNHIKSSKGFTLAEMAVVVLLISIMLTMGIGVLNAQREQSAINITKQRQEIIRDSLIAYLSLNKRLPCPDRDFNAPDGNGDDDRATSNNTATRCIAGFGLLPFANLNLMREVAQDGWGNFFSYHVSVSPNNWTLTSSFNAGSNGGIVINSRNAGVPAVIANNAVVVIVSHGRNGSGAYTVKGTRNELPLAGTDELINTNENIPAAKWKRDYTENPAAAGGLFDDIVLVISSNDLINPLLQRKGVRAFEEEVFQAQQELETIKNSLVGYVIVNNRLPTADSDNTGKVGCGAAGANDGVSDAGCMTGNVPAGTLGVNALDPWGTRYKYSVTSALTATANKTAFIAGTGTITVRNRNQADALLTTTPNVPFIIYSLGRNNVAYYVNAAGNNIICSAAAPVNPNPPLAPNCLGTNELANRAATAVFNIKPIVVPTPQTGFSPLLGFDDLLSFESKAAINSKLP